MRPLLVFFLFVTASFQAGAQGIYNEFGQGRLFGRYLHWAGFSSENFDAVYYGGNRELASYVLRVGEDNLKDVEKIMDFPLSGRIQFVVFSSFMDFQQSNVNLEAPELSVFASNTISSYRIVIYYTGRHDDLVRQVRAGISQVLLNELFFGGSITERIQNSAMLYLPEFFTKGLYAYVGESWNTTLDNKLRDVFIDGEHKRFNRLVDFDPTLAGHSLWRFLAESYGKQMVGEVIYLTKMTRSMENGLLYATGNGSQTIFRQWRAWYEKIYANDDLNRELPGTFIKLPSLPKLARITDAKISPNNRYLAYVANDLGKYKVYFQEIRNGKSKKVLSGGLLLVDIEADYTFPNLAWNNKSNQLAIAYERKGKLWLKVVNVRGNKEELYELKGLQKALSLDFSVMGDKLLITGVKAGQTDLYEFTFKGEVLQALTNDLYDDLYGHYADSAGNVLFASNRPDAVSKTSELYVLSPGSQTDLYYLDRVAGMQQLTHTPLASETQPMPLNDGVISFLSDENGIVNRYVMSPGKTAPEGPFKAQTNYTRSIIVQDVSLDKSKLVDLVYSGNRYSVLYTDLNIDKKEEEWISLNMDYTDFRVAQRKSLLQQAPLPAPVPKDSVVPGPPPKYTFQTPYPKSDQSSLPRPEMVKALLPLKNFRIRGEDSYRMVLGPEYFSSSLDVSIANTPYQLLTPWNDLYITNSLFLSAKMGVSDLLKDHRFSGGMRLAINLTGSDYFFNYEYLKGKIDHRIGLYRQSRYMEKAIGNDLRKARNVIHELRYSALYPVTHRVSLRGSLFFRQDKSVALSTDVGELLKVDNITNNAGSRLELIFDNAISQFINTNKGARMKVFGEYIAPLNKSGGLLIVGFDARYYLKLHREIVWANRLQGAATGGKDLVLYYLGGMENWVLPTAKSLSINYPQNYKYQVQVTQVRGFLLNSLQGSSYTLLNSELRVPLFTYLLHRPIRSEFWRSFMVVPFVDAGSAWNGLNPFNTSTPRNVRDFQAGDITGFVQTRSLPLMLGYGFGVRAKIFNYYVKYDNGWGWMERENYPRVQYLTIGLDF